MTRTTDRELLRRKLRGQLNAALKTHAMYERMRAIAVQFGHGPEIDRLTFALKETYEDIDDIIARASEAGFNEEEIEAG